MTQKAKAFIKEARVWVSEKGAIAIRDLKWGES